ncbi:hypothetical protein GJ496_008991 [Pomphorhynchus laevis]|nr:hypothetical protein GJ496_008991 [Pomphorhynchus laevis]
MGKRKLKQLIRSEAAKLARSKPKKAYSKSTTGSLSINSKNAKKRELASLRTSIDLLDEKFAKCRSQNTE